RRARVILDHAELIAGAADAVTNPRCLPPRVPGTADRAAIAGPRIAPAGHQLDRTPLDELFGAQVEDRQLVVVRPGAAAVPKEEPIGRINVPADLSPALGLHCKLQIDPLIDREIRAETPVAWREDQGRRAGVRLAKRLHRGTIFSRPDLFEAVGGRGTY